jgi:hypothetical protein
MPQEKYGLSYADFYYLRSINVKTTGNIFLRPVTADFHENIWTFCKKPLMPNSMKMLKRFNRGY